MEFGEKDFKNISIGLIILLLTVLAFLLIKPLINAIVGGLVLGYMFNPLYKKLQAKTQHPSLSAFILCISILLIIVIPLWFLTPRIIQEVFNVFSSSQSVDFRNFIKAFFPSSSPDFITQSSAAITNFVNKGSTIILNTLGDTLLDLPSVALQFLLVGFVFFFSLRDGAKLKEFVAGLSPFSKTKEGLFVRQFKDITDSVVYGIVIMGIFQGITAGFGFLIFGIPNALVLTIAATIFSIIPLIGPSVIWIPVNIYLFSTRSPAISVAYLLYNLIIVGTIDNIIRSYIVSRRSNVSQVIVIIGIVGGTILFGLMGVIIGPLILAYLITFLRAYKEKRIYSLFYEE